MRVCKHRAILALALALLVLCGACTGPAQPAQPGVSPNEVLTLTPIPTDKMVLTMRVGDGMDVAQIKSAIEARFPEVYLVVARNTSMNLDAVGGKMQDILLHSQPNGLRTLPEGTLIDLSSEDFTANYNISVLNSCSIDGKIYFLPGPSTVSGIVYDKELFTQNGWELPHSLDEFIALCQTIDATGMRALQPTIRYVSAARLLFAGFTYRDAFAGVDNYQWLEDFRVGKADMVGHMEPAMETMQRLLDAGVWKAGDYGVLPKERTVMLYRDHSCAMIMEGQMAPFFAEEFGEGQEHELGMMPFYSGNEPGSDYLIADPNFYIALNADLEQKGREAELKMARDILAYISTPEGQQAIINENTPLISNVLGTPSSQSDFLADVQETIDAGRVVYTPYYFGSINTKIDVVFYEKLREFAEGKLSAHDVLSACDAARDEMLAGADTQSLIGKAAEDFTVLEMSLYLAEAFRERADAQIGLCMANMRIQGCNTQLYAGDIYSSPDETSFGTMLDLGHKSDSDGQTLTKVSMTGQAILDVLEGLTGSSKNYPDAYVAASGLKIEFAPWAPAGERYRSVKLADGSELKPDEVYSVAVWQGVLEEADVRSVDERYKDSIVQLFTDKLNRDGGSIRPLQDERFVLNWDIPA